MSEFIGVHTRETQRGDKIPLILNRNGIASVESKKLIEDDSNRDQLSWCGAVVRFPGWTESGLIPVYEDMEYFKQQLLDPEILND